MRLTFCLTALLLAVLACRQPTPAPPPATPVEFYSLVADSTAGYDAVFAQKTGADNYGMKQYVLAFLKKGPNRSQDSVTAAQLQKAHLENIGRLAAAGKLVAAGPFMDDGDIRGIYVFNVPTIEEARQLTATDPAIQAGRLVMELHPWYSSAAVSLISPLHKRLEKTDVTK